MDDRQASASSLLGFAFGVLLTACCAAMVAAYDLAPGVAGRASQSLLEADETARLEAVDIATAGSLDPTQAVVELCETAGATLVARLTPQVPPGMPPHGGRVVVLDAGERRPVRLGEAFAAEDLVGNDIIVEVIEGDGRLAVRLLGIVGRDDPADEPTEPTVPLEMAGSLATVSRTPRRRLEVQKLTSTDLIDQAEAGGTIDHETSVLYRVYVIFGDARLPVAYRGNDAGAFESLYLETVHAEWATYSSATQAALAPFLMPPAYAGSWATPAATGGQAVHASTDFCGALSLLWAWVENPAGKVRVWFRASNPTDAGRALTVADAADTRIWPDLFGFMAPHKPLSDAGFSCNGGSDRLDIYLSDIGRSVTSPVGLNVFKCTETPAYIALNRAETNLVLAHEIFHAFTYSLPLASGCGSGPAYRWWTEGSAQWAMDKVYPSGREEQYMAQHMINAPELSLDLPTDPHMYSAYLLPFYYYRKTGSASWVKQAWENCHGVDAANAVHIAVAEGLDGLWPEVALHNWNGKPVTEYHDWDGMEFRPVKHDLPIPVALGSGSDREYTITYDLPKLSATYEHYTFPDSRVRSVRFWNGAGFDLQKTAGAAIVSPIWEAKPATAAAKEGVRVQALVKIAGREWQAPADWTADPSHSFCRDVADERIEELVLIISNSQFFDPGKRARPPGQDPRLAVSNVGCFKWTGTSTVVQTGSGSVLSVVARPLTWERVAESPSAPSPTVEYRATGVIAAAMTGACSGVGVFDVNAGACRMWTVNYAPVDTPGKRTYHLSGISFDTFPVTCGQGQSIASPGVWLFTPPGPPLMRVSSDGTAIKDTWTSPDGSSVYTWDLHNDPEP